VALPLVRPALATVVIFNFLTMWNEFAFALTLITKESMRTIPLALWNFSGERGTYLGQMCAALCVTIVPVLLVYAFAQRQIIRGLTAGAVRQ
jgi:ABC-type glycerol-3-phosphate transport system permease component